MGNLRRVASGRDTRALGTTVETVQEVDPQAVLVEYDSVTSVWDFRNTWFSSGVDLNQFRVGQLCAQMFKAGKCFGLGVTLLELLGAVIEIGPHAVRVLHAHRLAVRVWSFRVT